MIQILPAILATTEEEYKTKLTKIETSSQLFNGWIQVDLMDNKFVQNQSVGVDIMAKYPTKELRIEAQLMVQYPENWIDELVKIDVHRIIFPLEDIAGEQNRIQHVLNHGKEVGLSINPETPVEKIEPFLSTINVVLVMSVKPGFGGQKFIPETLDKVKKIKAMGMPIRVGVDGGVTPEHVKQLDEAGADYVVMGSHLLEGDIDENFKKINQALYS